MSAPEDWDDAKAEAQERRLELRDRVIAALVLLAVVGLVIAGSIWIGGRFS